MENRGIQSFKVTLPEEYVFDSMLTSELEIQEFLQYLRNVIATTQIPPGYSSDLFLSDFYSERIRVILIDTSIGRVSSTPFVLRNEINDRVYNILRTIPEDSSQEVSSNGVWTTASFKIEIIFSFRSALHARGSNLSFKTGMDKYLVLSHLTVFNCIFTCFAHFLKISQSDENIFLDNERVCQEGRNLKKCLERFILTNRGRIDQQINFENINQIVPIIRLYLKEKRKKDFKIFIYNIKFSLIYVFGSGKEIIELRIQDAHCQLLLRKDLFEEEFLKKIQTNFKFYQPTNVLENSDVKLFKDPLLGKYFLHENQIFSSINEFENYCYKKNLNFFEKNFDSKIKFNSSYVKKKEFNIQKIGAYDIEAYDRDGVQIPFAIILCWNSEKNNAYKIFKGEKCIVEFLNFLNQNITFFEGYSLYAHNQSNYDGFHILKNLFLKTNFYIAEKNLLIINGGFLKFSVAFGWNKLIHFKDSIRILPMGLAKIGKEFKVEHQKLNCDIESLAKNYEANWQEIEKYIINDGLCLLEVILELKNILQSEDLCLTECLTAPSICVELFRRNFLKVKLPILSSPFERIVRSSYFGGRCEANKLGIFKSDENGIIAYLDFNSLYPFVMKKYDLPCGKYSYKSYKSMVSAGFIEDGKLTDSAYGFVRVKVKGSACLHGYKNKERLMFPVFDEWTDITIWSEELKYGQTLETMEYQILEMITFEKEKVFSAYVDHYYEKKKNATSNATTIFYKLLLNSLYGYTGMKLNRTSIHITNKEKNDFVDLMWTSGKLKEISEIGKHLFIEFEDTITSKLDAPYLASAITSGARLEEYKAIYELKKLGSDILYMDTDSIIFKIKDLQNFKSSDFFKDYMLENKDLGKLKDEFFELAIKKKISLETLKERSIEKNYECIYDFILPIDEIEIAGCKMYKAITKVGEQTLEKSALKGMKNSLNIDFHHLFSEEGIDSDELQFRSKKPSIFSKTGFECLDIHVSKVKKNFKSIYFKGEKIVKDEFTEIRPFCISEIKNKIENCSKTREWNFIRQNLYHESVTTIHQIIE